ncbi:MULTISPECIES: PstS family phosphate ABC transporter substrate-binding protein [Bacteria]|jgi:phosphate transport system substrate-binding protein
MNRVSPQHLFPTRRLRAVAVAAAVVTSALALSACAGPTEADSTGSLEGAVVTDGSSTVAPFIDAASYLFEAVEPDVDVVETISGTSAGFRAFCDGETDISNASRAISDDELAACKEAGVEFTEIIVANDGLSVVINPENDWATDLTLEQLATMWAPDSEGEITNWNQVDPDFPDEPLILFGAGGDSGTFDYFSEAVNGEEGALRMDYSASEDDNATVEGVRRELGGIGFLGLSYVEENEGLIAAASVDGVAPTTDTVQDGSYTPLSRPLFIYVDNAAYADKPQVKAFVDFTVENSADIAERALVVPLTDDQITLAQDELASLR